jgi:hypothetical protein
VQTALKQGQITAHTVLCIASCFKTTAKEAQRFNLADITIRELTIQRFINTLLTSLYADHVRKT